jgi:hypothetical protein
VRASLSYLEEAQAMQDRDDDARAQRRDAPHALRDLKGLGAHEGRL